MDKNFLFLNNFLNTLDRVEIDSDILRQYLSEYFDTGYIDDSIFLKSVDLLNMNFSTGSVDSAFDYKKHIDFDIPHGSDVFVFLNDELFFFERYEDSVTLSVFNRENFDTFTKKSLFNDKFLFNNLNFFLILNLLFYRFFKYFYVNNTSLGKKCLYILNFFDNNFPGSMIFPRTFCNFASGCNVNVLEFFFNLSDKTFVNSSTYFFLEDDTEVNYVFLNESKFCVSRTHSFYSKLFTSSKLFYNNYNFGCNYFKNNNYVFLLGNLCKFYSKIGSFIKNKSVNNIVLKVFNLGDNSISRSKFRTVASDFAICSFLGFIDVDVYALNVDAGLDCKSLLLNTNAFIKIAPELSIKNSNVKCFHGATIGFLDDNVIFYLMSRCFSRSDCTSLLVNTFLYELIDVNDGFLCSFIYCLFKKYYV